MLCFKHKILSRNGLLGRPATDNRWIENDPAFRPNNESVHLTRLELTKTFFESDHFGVQAALKLHAQVVKVIAAQPRLVDS